MDIREAIKINAMRWYQFVVLIICILLTMIDGYEIIVMPFVMPHLAKAWKLSPVEIGYLLSASVAGMAIGAVIVSPLADRIGRRRHILLCLVLVTVGMLLTSMSRSMVELLVFRAFAGLFIGGIISSINVLLSEYCSDKRRGFIMGLYGVGLPLGSALAGSAVGPLVREYSWRGPFVFGGLLTLILLVIVFAFLPESIDYLIARRPKRALEKYNRIADRLCYPHATVLPNAETSTGGHSIATTLQSIFGSTMGCRTSYLWLGYAGLIAAFYFANTWTAKLIADASGVPEFGIRVGALVMYGGVIGAVVFALLSLKLRPVVVTALILFGGAVTYSLYASNFRNTGLAVPLSVLVGLFSGGGVVAFYAISPAIYPAIVRSTAVGLMLGFGRTVAVAVPIGTGYLLRLGWTPSTLYQGFGGILAAAAVFALLLDRTRSEPEGNAGTYEPTQKRV
ncbi:MFS transporter [Paraburkholderia sp. BCC1884]|uniref:MFS transporter n=1 Tax=Paraburkholderia sp. BCC1884 TaxID=2562668 RepID=UPI0011843176|nr:MFS transporter [Paraburkholderia sp. BCC1884]